MLNSSDALEAIKYFYNDFLDNLVIGNPLPFVKSYDKDTIVQFNELMIDGGFAKNIFYGTVTYAMASKSGVATTTRISVFVYRNPDGSVVQQAFDIGKLYSGVEPEFATGTSNGLFVQQVVLEETTFISFDGYIFGLEKKSVIMGFNKRRQASEEAFKEEIVTAVENFAEELQTEIKAEEKPVIEEPVKVEQVEKKPEVIEKPVVYEDTTNRILNCGVTGDTIEVKDFRAIVKKQGKLINVVLTEILADWNAKNYNL